MREYGYPEGVFEKFTIQFLLDKQTGKYMIYSPEWHCEIAGGKNPLKEAVVLINEILDHNEAEMKGEVEK